MLKAPLKALTWKTLDQSLGYYTTDSMVKKKKEKDHHSRYDELVMLATAKTVFLNHEVDPEILQPTLGSYSSGRMNKGMKRMIFMRHGGAGSVFCPI